MTGLAGPVHPPLQAVREAVRRALDEDLLPIGDLTASLLPEGARGRGWVVARAEGVLAGTLCASEAFRAVDATATVEWSLGDGDPLLPGRRIGAVEGPLASLLSAERTALNFLCHLSGVATATRRFVEAVCSAGTSTAVLDTRKTTPGLRSLEKAAVRAGGGLNHRGSLSEGVLVKDNHLSVLGVAEAVGEARRRWPGRMVEVECDTVEQVRDALEAGAPMIMLDNMDPALVGECVRLARGVRPAALLEVSGGVSLEDAAAFASAGADLISVGALTHSAGALDIGLDMES